MRMTREEAPFIPPASPAGSPRRVAQAMRLKRLGSLKNIAKQQAGGAAPILPSMASLAISQHTEISYYSTDNYSIDDDDDGFCGDSSVGGGCEGGMLHRGSSKRSLGSTCSAFTLGDLGSIESVSSLECDDVDYGADDMIKEQSKEEVKPNLREIFCRKPSGSRLGRTASYTSLGANLSDLDENETENDAGTADNKSVNQDELFVPSPKAPPLHFHKSFAALGSAALAPPDLRHATSGSSFSNLNFPPELDLEKAIQIWEQLAKGVSEDEVEEAEPKTSNKNDIFRNVTTRRSRTGSLDAKSKRSSYQTIRSRDSLLSYDFTEIIEEETPAKSRASGYRTIQSRESLMSYDFTEIVVDDEDEIEEETIVEEIIEEEEEEEEEEVVEEEEEEEVLSETEHET